jgi:NitT/TauT family transport system permease protein
MEKINRYSRKDLTSAPSFGGWDVVAMLVLFCCIFALGWTTKQMFLPFSLEDSPVIYLDAAYLPGYALKSVLRMFIALFVSLIFTFIVGTAAAKSRRAEKIIIPMIDLLQSIPVLGFLSISVGGFIALFPGKILGPEFAAIFAVFTSQAWNIMLSFYQSLRTIPESLEEAVKSMHLNSWQRFWRLEVPFAMPGLVWNTMLSLSAGWFFVVASEAISIANHTIRLPGIGSYIALAIEKADSEAIGFAIFTMFCVIFLYDALILKPLVFWSNKFNINFNKDDSLKRPWVVKLFAKTWISRAITSFLCFIHEGLFSTFGNKITNNRSKIVDNKKLGLLFYYFLILLIIVFVYYYVDFSKFYFIKKQDILLAFSLGFVTTVRIFTCITIATLIWLPIGVWVGFRPNIANKIQPIIQFLAAFPANLLFPVVVIFIVKNQLNVNIWTSPLIILGTQWYILFNVIAGVQSLPRSAIYAVESMRLPMLVWWKSLILPGIFPHLITGIITAVGGAWNASIVAEYVEWGQHKLIATGLGSYIASCYRSGDFIHLSLGIVVMCIFVLIINRVLWLPLCHLAQKRCQ